MPPSFKNYHTFKRRANGYWMTQSLLVAVGSFACFTGCGEYKYKK